MAQSAFTMNVQVKEALTPPDTFMVVSAISAPTITFEYKLSGSQMVTPSANKLSHLNSYIINKSDEISVQDTLILACHFMEVETVLKFPYLIRQNSLKRNRILTVGLVS